MNIKKYIYGVVAAVVFNSTVIAGSYSFNHDEDYYITVFGRALNILNQDVGAGSDDFGIEAGGADYEVNYEDAYSVGAIIGFPLVKSFRGEVEGSYSWYDYSDFDGTADLTIDGTTYTLGGSSKVDGWGRAVSIFSNLIWDVKGDTGISFLKPYVGWGFGAVRSKEKIDTIVIAGAVVDVYEVDRDTNFATQLFIGADVLNTTNWSGGIRLGGARIFINHEEPQSDVEIIGAQLNLRYNF